MVHSSEIGHAQSVADREGKRRLNFLSSGLMNYWRDEAVHEVASPFSSTEAELALVKLSRFAVFVQCNWDVPTRR